MDQRAGGRYPDPVRSNGFDGFIDESQRLLKIVFPDISSIYHPQRKMGLRFGKTGSKDIIQLRRTTHQVQVDRVYGKAQRRLQIWAVAFEIAGQDDLQVRAFAFYL